MRFMNSKLLKKCRNKMDNKMDNKIANDLSKLFLEARRYGKVSIFTMSDGYHCKIEFNTIDHTTLEAKSRFNHDTPEDAVIFAIETAKEIVASISNMKKELDADRLLK